MKNNLSVKYVHKNLNEFLEAGTSMAADVGTNILCISFPQLEILIHRHEKNQSNFLLFPFFLSFLSSFLLSFLFINPFESQCKIVHQQENIGCGMRQMVHCTEKEAIQFFPLLMWRLNGNVFIYRGLKGYIPTI